MVQEWIIKLLLFDYKQDFTAPFIVRESVKKKYITANTLG